MQTRREILDHEDGKLYIWQYEDKIFLDSQIFGPLTKRSLREWRSILLDVEDQLEKHGVVDLYCLTATPGAFKFCQLMGFISANEYLEIPNMNPIELMKKDISYG